MIKIPLKVKNNLLTQEELVTIASGSSNSIKVKFNIDQNSDFADNTLTKRAIFRYYQGSYFISDVDANSEVYVPKFVIAYPYFKVALRAENENATVVVTSNEIQVPVEKSPVFYETTITDGDVAIGNLDGTLNVYKAGDVTVIDFTASYKTAVDAVIAGTYATASALNSVESDVALIKDDIINISNSITDFRSDIEELENNKADKSNTYTKTESDALLATAKDYADTQSASALSSAKTYADGQATSALDNANAFTTAEVNKIKNGTYVADKANRDGSGNTITRKYFADIDKTYNSNTGVLTLKLYSADNTLVKELEIDLPTESIIQSFTYDSTTKEIVMTDMAGNEHRIPVGDLVDTYTFTDGDTIQFTVSNNTVTCEVKNNSIDVTKLNEALRTLLGSFATDTDLEQGLSTKQPLYSSGSTQWDTQPTQNSTKPVTSGGIYTAIEDAKTAVKEAVADIDVEDSNKKYITHLESREDGLYLVGEEI